MVPFSLKQSQTAASKHARRHTCALMAPWWIMAMICTACACACAMPSGENVLEHLGHFVPFASTMPAAKFANLEAQVAMLTDLLRNLAPTANAAQGPLCILAIMVIAVCACGCFGRDVPKPVGGMRDKKTAEKAAGNAGVNEPDAATKRQQALAGPQITQRYFYVDTIYLFSF